MCCCVVMRQVWRWWIVLHLLLLLLLETGESIRTHGNNTDEPVSHGTDSEEGFWRWSAGQWRRSGDVDVVDVEARGSPPGGKRRGGWATLSTRLWNMIKKTRQDTDRVALCGGRYSVSEGRSYTFTLTDNATCSMIFTAKGKASLKLVCPEQVVEESCLHLTTRKKTYTYCGEGKAKKVSLNAMTELLVVYRLYDTSHDITRTSQDTNQRDTNTQDTKIRDTNIQDTNTTTQDTKILDTNIQQDINTTQDTKILDINQRDNNSKDTNPSQNINNPSQNTNNPSQNTNNPSQDTNPSSQDTNPSHDISPSHDINPSHDTNTTTTTTTSPSQNTNPSSQNTNNPSQNTNPSSQNTNNPSQNTNNPSQNTNNPSQNTNNPSQNNTNNPSQNTNNPLQNTNNPSQNTNNPSQNTNNPSQNINRALQNTRILQCRVVGRKGNKVYRAKGRQACPLSCGATTPDARVNIPYFPSPPVTPRHSAGHVEGSLDTSRTRRGTASGETKEGIVTLGRESSKTSNTIHDKQPHQGPEAASNDITINKETLGHLKTMDDSEGRDRETREEQKVKTERRYYKETGEEQTVNTEEKDRREAREEQEVNTELMTLLDKLTESNEAKMKTMTTTTKNKQKRYFSSPVMRIKGGQEAGVGEWPWMVYLKIRMHNTVLSCGGSILTASFVLTAAHCVYDVEQDKGHRIRVVAYEHDLKDKHETPRQVVLVHTTFLHPTFNIDTLEGDIALLSLKKPLVLGVGVATVCLAPPGDYEGREVVVLGWGAVSINGADSRVLLEGSMKVVNQKECAANYSTLSHNNLPVTPLHVCNAEPGVDSCVGDSGGPLVLRQGATWYQLGIVSFGKGCAKEGFPGVNTLVPSYTRWILSTINKYYSTSRDTKAEECYHESRR